jgi:CubicO group peptidase (beta-lactamase class C family)
VIKMIQSIPLSRRSLLGRSLGLAAGLALPAVLTSPARAQAAALETLLDDAERLSPLRTVLIARDGEVVAERGYRGNTITEPTNIKSASKPIVGALIGLAIARGELEGADQLIAPILRDDIPDDADPRIEEITIEHLLTMRAGLEPTSGPRYGQWVGSSNWVRFALGQSFAADPGTEMLYSTGSTHLLSAILTRVTGRSSLENARDWLAPLDNFSIDGWERDPQGIYLGGNEMAMSARSLLAFGELYRNGGVEGGEAILTPDWVTRSWNVYTRSIYSGDGYGYGWFVRQMAGEDLHYAWGYGGQMLYVVPRLGLSVVMTSDSAPRSTTIADRDNLHALSERIIAAVRSA